MSRIEDALEKAAKIRIEATQRLNATPREKFHILFQGPLESPAKELEPKAFGRTKLITKQPTATDPDHVTDHLLLAARDPRSAVAEEYRKMKSSVVKLTEVQPRKNMLMVTSSVRNEGNSITALNLAVTLAQEYDHTVLLVDADLRKPSLHHYLGLRPSGGLADCLLEGKPLKEVLLKTEFEKLTLLPGGQAINNPGEIFSSLLMRDFLLDIKNRYPNRYIIVDTPPILPFADSRSISRIFDGIILVIKEGSVPLKSLQETLECLYGTEILGAVYNQAQPEPGGASITSTSTTKANT